MFRPVPTFQVLLPAAIAVLVWNCAPESAAQPSPSFQSADEKIADWIKDLGSGDFQQRRAAVESLKNAGDEAIGPLQSAVKAAPLDQRLLMESILRELKQNSFSMQLEEVSRRPDVKTLAKFPEFDRFATLVGRSDADLGIYVRLLQAEPQLYAAAMKNSRSLPDLLEARAASLVRATRPAPVKVERFTIEAYGALLLLAGNEQHRLPRATSTNISQMLTCADVREAVLKPEAEWLLRIAGSYIQRPRIAPAVPLMFAREHRLPEGLTLARTVLQSSLRGRNGIYAMMVIHEQGEEQDIALLESLLDNKGILFKGPTNDADRPYVVYNGDLALAVALVMRQQDPRQFGFVSADDPNQKFRLAMDTVGFRDEQQRAAAVAKYRAQFSSPNSAPNSKQ